MSYSLLNKVLLLSISIGINLASRLIGKTLDCREGNRVQAGLHLVLTLAALLPCIALYSTPEEFSEVQLTMKLRIEVP